VQGSICTRTYDGCALFRREHAHVRAYQVDHALRLVKREHWYMYPDVVADAIRRVTTGVSGSRAYVQRITPVL